MVTYSGPSPPPSLAQTPLFYDARAIAANAHLYSAILAAKIFLKMRLVEVTFKDSLDGREQCFRYQWLRKGRVAS
jgi:hypothetical protein